MQAERGVLGLRQVGLGRAQGDLFTEARGLTKTEPLSRRRTIRH